MATRESWVHCAWGPAAAEVVAALILLLWGSSSRRRARQGGEERATAIALPFCFVGCVVAVGGFVPNACGCPHRRRGPSPHDLSAALSRSGGISLLQQLQYPLLFQLPSVVMDRAKRGHAGGEHAHMGRGTGRSSSSGICLCPLSLGCVKDRSNAVALRTGWACICPGVLWGGWTESPGAVRSIGQGHGTASAPLLWGGVVWGVGRHRFD